MAELIQLGEEVGSDLQRLELVEKIGGILRDVGGRVGGAHPSAETTTDVGKESHRGGIKEKATKVQDEYIQ